MRADPPDPKAGTLYEPHGAREWDRFLSTLCANCKQGHEDYSDNLCDILLHAESYEREDDDYPKEWQHNRADLPTCTAYQDRNAPDIDPRCDSTPDMFGTKA